MSHGNLMELYLRKPYQRGGTQKVEKSLHPLACGCQLPGDMWMTSIGRGKRDCGLIPPGRDVFYVQYKRGKKALG